LKLGLGSACAVESHEQLGRAPVFYLVLGQVERTKVAIVLEAVAQVGSEGVFDVAVLHRQVANTEIS